MTSEPIDTDRAAEPIDGRCNRRSSRTGKPCKKYPVKGAKVCATHGGKAPQVKAAAERRVAEQAAEKAARTYGLPVAIPADRALLDELHRTVGHVTWLGALIGDMDQDGLTQWGEGGKQASVWVGLYQDERRHLAKVAKDVLGTSLAERQVKLAEEQGALLAAVIGRILDRLGLTEQQQGLVRVVVPEELRKIEQVEIGASGAGSV